MTLKYDFYNVSLVLYGLLQNCINISYFIHQEITWGCIEKSYFSALNDLNIPYLILHLKASENEVICDHSYINLQTNLTWSK